MEKQDLAEKFTGNHLQLVDFVTALSPAQQQFKAGDKWSALQQLHHIVLVLQPIDFILGSKEKMEEKFGTINRGGMTYDALLQNYFRGLSDGGKAPERFLPAATETLQAEELSVSIKKLLAHITEQLSGFTEADMDRIAVPHPFLGNLSLREMLYLMSYHPLHHLNQIREHQLLFTGR